MNRDASLPYGVHRKVRGFTLLEILIVGALIALFAGLAVVAIQQFYEDNRRKAMFDETKSLGTALSFAHDDIAFFPRLHLLAMSKTMVTRGSGTVVDAIRPGFDCYGTLAEVSPFSSAVTQNWRGPYMGQSEARVRISQGSKGLTKMRLPDTSEQQVQAWSTQRALTDISIVDWPTDTWGNPYVVYLVVSEPSPQVERNPLGLRLINRAGETANYMTAVVSYGRNGVPGGTDIEMVPAADRARAVAFIDRMRQARMYVVLNAVGGEPDSFADPQAAYALRCYYPIVQQSQTSFNSNFSTIFPVSITNRENPGDVAQPGILDSGSDDLVWRF